MNIIVLIGIAVGLSMDALAVSVANGIMIKKLQVKHAFRIAFSFGFFQAIMPLIGWAAGITFSTYIKEFDHWIAFVLLLIVGSRMIWESYQSSKSDEAMRNPLSVSVRMRTGFLHRLRPSRDFSFYIRRELFGGIGRQFEANLGESFTNRW